MYSMSGPGRSSLAIKEGFLGKQGGFLKTWSRKYFLLNKQSLVYFRKDQSLEEVQSKADMSPQGRIFLSDVVKVESEEEDRRKSQFLILTKKHKIKLQASNEAEVHAWIEAIQKAIESEGEAEAKDHFRKSLRKLAPGLKRVTLTKDAVKGIGCTIKSAAGHIFVNAIIEDGPIAFTGVLRPDDEILEVNAVSLKGMSVMEVGGVIRNCPNEFLATVRPVSALKKYHRDAPRGSYATRMANFNTFTSPVSPPKSQSASSATSTNLPSHQDNSSSNSNGFPKETSINTPALSIRPPTPDHTHPAQADATPPPPDSASLLSASDEGSLYSSDDMGDYDDEHDTDS